MNYTRTNLVKALRATSVKIAFTKANGRKRTLTATLQDGVVPSEYKNDVRRTVRNVKNQDYITVWSESDQDFRSIRFDSIKTVERLAA